MKKNLSILRTKPEIDDRIMEKISKSKQNAFTRYPLLFSLLAAFGLVITNNGMQGVISKLSWLNNNPYVTLIVGILILLFTGTLYKKL
jgi:hypothetical protein